MFLFAIVEGDGDVQAINSLIVRVAKSSPDGYAVPLNPSRVKRHQLVRQKQDGVFVDPNTTKKHVTLANNKLTQAGGADSSRAILILLDADDDCPSKFGPELLAKAREYTDLPVIVAFAKRDYESWLIAGAEGFEPELNPGALSQRPPECESVGKGWLKRQLRRGVYSETVDQPRLTSQMNITAACSRSPSFARFHRKITELLSSRA